MVDAPTAPTAPPARRIPTAVLLAACWVVVMLVTALFADAIAPYGA